MKVLVAGAGGQVGRALLGSVPAGFEVRGTARADLDVADAAAVLACVRTLQPQVIINATAYTAVDRAESEPESARRVNEDGARFLAEAAAAVGARLVHLSTDFVFDGSASVPYAPDAPTGALNVYGRTKRAGEQAVLGALPQGAAVLRTAWVYAATGRNFLHTMLAAMRERGAVRVVADQVGTPTAAASVAEAVWALVAQPAAGGIYHWTDAGVASWYDFAVAIAEEGAQLGLLPATARVTPIGTADYPTPARRPAYSVLDKRRLSELGLQAEHWRVRLRGVLRELAHG